MCADKVAEPLSAGSRIEVWLTWVGGGERRELNERHERSAHAVAGVIVLLNAALAWLVTTLAVMEATRMLGLKPEIVHANDWQTGLVPALVNIEYRGTPGFEHTKGRP